MRADALGGVSRSAVPGSGTEMTPLPVSFTEDGTVVEAVAKMLHLGIDRIPVVHQGVPVGIVTRQDILRLVLRLLSGWPQDVGHESPSADGPSPADDTFLENAPRERLAAG